MTDIKEKDLLFGEKNEIELFEVFKKHIDSKFCKTGKFNEMDFISPTSYLELKSRNCKFTDYKEIMIGENKIRFAEKTDKNVFLAWKFTDGLYFYRFNKDDITNGKIIFKMGGRCDRGRDERKTTAFINSDLLQEIKI